LPDLQDADPRRGRDGDTGLETGDSRQRERAPAVLLTFHGCSYGPPRAVSSRRTPAPTLPYSLQKMSSPLTPTVATVQNRTWPPANRTFCPPRWLIGTAVPFGRAGASARIGIKS